VRSLTGASTQSLECRDLKHSWRWRTDFFDLKEGGKIVSVFRSLECSRCLTIRYDEYSYPHMNKVRSSYGYQPGYHISGGHVPVSDVRRELYNRRKSTNRRKKAS
jgi:predicted DNA-binding protein (MmcQ/YjbR family)